MQKKLIASAVACLCLGTAQAQTAVTIEGRVDVGYSFDRAQNNDSSTGLAQGGKTTETMKDNTLTTTNLVFKASETLAAGYSANVLMDLRFGSFVEGKSGLSGNDRKILNIASPFGTVQWGVFNPAGHNYSVAEKPYVSTPKDLNAIQYGVAYLRETKLTHRNTELRTAAIPLGSTEWALKGSYALGDGRKAGSNDADGAHSGDAYSVGFEGAWGKVNNELEKNRPFMSWGYDFNLKGSTSNDPATKNSIQQAKAFYTIRPLPQLKLAATYIMFNGYNPGAGAAYGSAYQEKNFAFDAQYNFGSKAVLGAYYSRLNDMGQARNSGTGWGMSAYYFLSKTLSVGATLTKQDFQRNETIDTSKGGRYDGTASGFLSTSGLKKVDGRQFAINIMKNF